MPTDTLALGRQDISSQDMMGTFLSSLEVYFNCREMQYRT